MKKFTIFTILLTIVVVVVFVELMAKDSLSGAGRSSDLATEQDEDGMKLTLPKSLDVKKSLATNVLGSEGIVNDGDGTGENDGDLVNRLETGGQIIPSIEIIDDPVALPDEANPDYLDPNAFVSGDQKVGMTTQPPTQVTDTTGGVKDFEDENFISVSNNIYLRDEQIKSAGFTGGYLENEPLDGRLFKTIDISDLKDVEVTKTDIRSKDEILAKVYVFKIGFDANVNDVYQLLKMRAMLGLNIKINETNEFGLASYYMNDPTRSDTAFLTVRISGLIYAFSYPKTYHSQVKNLIQLIQWELG